MTCCTPATLVALIITGTLIVALLCRSCSVPLAEIPDETWIVATPSSASRTFMLVRHAESEARRSTRSRRCCQGAVQWLSAAVWSFVAFGITVAAVDPRRCGRYLGLRFRRSAANGDHPRANAREARLRDRLRWRGQAWFVRVIVLGQWVCAGVARGSAGQLNQQLSTMCRPNLALRIQMMADHHVGLDQSWCACSNAWPPSPSSSPCRCWCGAGCRRASAGYLPLAIRVRHPIGDLPLMCLQCRRDSRVDDGHGPNGSDDPDPDCRAGPLVPAGHAQHDLSPTTHGGGRLPLRLPPAPSSTRSAACDLRPVPGADEFCRARRTKAGASCTCNGWGCVSARRPSAMTLALRIESAAFAALPRRCGRCSVRAGHAVLARLCTRPSSARWKSGTRKARRSSAITELVCLGEEFA